MSERLQAYPQMNEQQTIFRSRIKRIAFTPMFPLWMDAFVLDWIVQIVAWPPDFWPYVWRYGLRDWEAVEIGAIFFLLAFFLIYIPALCMNNWRSGLLWGALAAFLVTIMLTPKLAS